MMQQESPVSTASTWRTIVYRTVGGEASGGGLPLVVRSAGHYCVGPDYLERFKEPRWFTELYWTISGSGTFRVGDERFTVGPGDIFIYPPSEAHHLSASADHWEYRWITFDGRDTDTVFAMFGLNRTGHAGACPEALFDQVSAALESPTMQGVRAASVAAYAILEAASRRGASSSANSSRDARGAEAIRRELDEHYRDASTGVDSVADRLGYHRTTVLRVFRAKYGISPSAYLTRRRLQQALALLRTTELPVADVASAAGFRSPEYLARLVRAETRLSPTEFRRGPAPRAGG